MSSPLSIALRLCGGLDLFWTATLGSTFRPRHFHRCPWHVAFVILCACACVCARLCACVCVCLCVFHTRLGAPSGRGTYTAAPSTLPSSSCICMCTPYRLGFSLQPQKNILNSHSHINPAPWKYLFTPTPHRDFCLTGSKIRQKSPFFNPAPPK